MKRRQTYEPMLHGEYWDKKIATHLGISYEQYLEERMESARVIQAWLDRYSGEADLQQHAVS